MKKFRRPRASSAITASLKRRTRVASLVLVVFVHLVATAFAQSPEVASSRPLPKEIRGYKVERVGIKRRPEDKQNRARDKQRTSGDKGRQPPDAKTESLVQLGEPRITAVTLLGLTLEVSLIIAPVKQGGEIDFLLFEDMRVNGTPVAIEEYKHKFRLPGKAPLTLENPVKIYITTPRLLLGAYDEWNESKETWPVTGRVYVCGRYKKFLLTFKRAVPVDINLELPNPVRDYRQKASLD